MLIFGKALMSLAKKPWGQQCQEIISNDSFSFLLVLSIFGFIKTFTLTSLNQDSQKIFLRFKISIPAKSRILIEPVFERNKCVLQFDCECIFWLLYIAEFHATWEPGKCSLWFLSEFHNSEVASNPENMKQTRSQFDPLPLE